MIDFESFHGRQYAASGLTARPFVSHACLMAVGLIAVVGCGKQGAPTGSVSGHVTFASQPVAQGFVVFENRTQGWLRAVPLDSSGGYQLPEVGVGEYTISVQPPEPERPSESSGTPAQIRAKMATVKIIDPKNIPRPFRSFETTPLKRSVAPGANTFDFDLATAQK
jgi:hypothetical protein